MTPIRLFLYSLDAISLWLLIERAQHSRADVLIFDRYIYDELANLELHRWLMRAYARVLFRFVPKPDISYLLDADPIAARARKPEYPLEFLEFNRKSYFALNNLVSNFEVIAPGQSTMWSKKSCNAPSTRFRSRPRRILRLWVRRQASFADAKRRSNDHVSYPCEALRRPGNLTVAVCLDPRAGRALHFVHHTVADDARRARSVFPNGRRHPF